MTRLIPPCKDCPDRAVGCHSICEKYITYDKANKKLKEQMKKIAIQEQIQNDIEHDRKKKLATGQFWRSKRRKG